jgi:hypothetical protein
VFKNWVLRRVYGSKRDEVTGDWRKLHNDKLCDMYSSPNIICLEMEEDEMGRSHGTDGEKRNAHRHLAGTL